ncbi:MAG: 23S rRNA (adenine(2503)-C(2))-methyltransferase RlmN [Culicoidibacterales bacterium]
MKPTIYDFTYEQLEAWMLENGEKKFRAQQIWNWLYIQQVKEFSEMNNVSKVLLEKLTENFVISPLTVNVVQASVDGTRKYLFNLNDGTLIETVLMPHKYGNSVCVTTQVGCNIGCSFCASGTLRKQRDLTAGEIMAQVMLVQHDLNSLIEAGEEPKRVSHIVIMGIGEPFDNYDNFMDFLHIVNHPKGLAIGARHITVSTSGIVPKIRQFATEGLQVNLAISLHAPNDEVRSNIMKINSAYPIPELMAATREYIAKTNRRVTFEYIMMKGVNDQIIHARQLVKLVRGMNVYINLIPFNAVDEHGYQRSTKEDVSAFFDHLKKEKIQVQVRREFGHDIDAACGQLRAKKLETE